MFSATGANQEEIKEDKSNEITLVNAELIRSNTEKDIENTENTLKGKVQQSASEKIVQ